MKSAFLVLAIVASSCAFDTEEIPSNMKDRLDSFVSLKKRWEEKWLAMNDEEQKNYENILISRLEQLPKLEMSRLHDRIVSLPEEHRTGILDFLRRRFPLKTGQVFANDMQEINFYIMTLPQQIREKISNSIPAQFQEATAYNGVSHLYGNLIAESYKLNVLGRRWRGIKFPRNSWDCRYPCRNRCWLFNQRIARRYPRQNWRFLAQARGLEAQVGQPSRRKEGTLRTLRQRKDEAIRMFQILPLHTFPIPIRSCNIVNWFSFDWINVLSINLVR